jgi:RecB family endonuclease NucS
MEGDVSEQQVARKLKIYNVKYIKVNSTKQFATIELGDEQQVREAIAEHPQLLTLEQWTQKKAEAA